MIWTPQLFVPQMFAGIWHQAGCCCWRVEIGDDCEYCVEGTTPVKFTLTFDGISPCTGDDGDGCPETCITEALAALHGNTWTVEQLPEPGTCTYHLSGNRVYELAGGCSNYGLYLTVYLYVQVAGDQCFWFVQVIADLAQYIVDTWFIIGRLYLANDTVTSGLCVEMDYPDCTELSNTDISNTFTQEMCDCDRGGINYSAYGGTADYAAGP